MRPLVFTPEMGSSSSTDCTLIWTFTTLSGKNPAGGSSGLPVLSPGSLRHMHWLSNPVATRSEFDATQRHCHTANMYKNNNCWFCICSILDILRGEARVLEGLHNLGIKGEHQGKLLRLPVNAVDDSYALDIRHPAIMVSLVLSKSIILLAQINTAGVFSSLCTSTRVWISGSVIRLLQQPRACQKLQLLIGKLAKKSYQIKNLQVFILAPLAILIF